MNTARLTAARPRNRNGVIHARPATTPFRTLLRAWLGALGRHQFGADPRQQLWTWFLPNPVIADESPSVQPGGTACAHAPRATSVLLVEHDRDTRDRLRLWLQLDGFLVAEACDEIEALKVIAQEPPELLLLDLCQQGMSWVNFFVGLNRLRPRPDVRVIGMVPCAAGAAGAEGIRFFASDVLQKPVRQDDLRCAVAAALKETAGPSSEAEVPRRAFSSHQR
jgi:CheY-like chemotaxis protein